MASHLRHAWSLLPLAGLAFYGYMRVNVIRMDNYFDTILWTFRSWRYPVSKNMSEWTMTRDDDDTVLMRRTFRAINTWKFWSPFFASRGYTLYTRRGTGSLLLAPASPPPALQQEYPFARLVGTPEDFEYVSMCVWPARDRLGRDVIIKLVSGSEPSQELEALQRLNSPLLRANPRNRTIPILEFINWDAMVFAVMPRWFCAFFVDFQYLGEAIHLWEQLLEGLEFCHEHRVANCDILAQNTMLDVSSPTSTIFKVKSVMGPESRYAFIDFGHASVLPYTVALEDAPLRDNLIYRSRSGVGVRGPCNPFVADVMFLGSMMERLIRMAPEVFPEGIHLLDKMMGINGLSVPTAAEALSELRIIKTRLNKDALQFYFPGSKWGRGTSKGYHITPRS